MLAAEESSELLASAGGASHHESHADVTSSAPHPPDPETAAATAEPDAPLDNPCPLADDAGLRRAIDAIAIDAISASISNYDPRARTTLRLDLAFHVPLASEETSNGMVVPDVVREHPRPWMTFRMTASTT